MRPRLRHRAGAARALGAVATLVLLLAAGGCGQRSAPPASAWEALPLGTSADFRGLWFADADHGWIVGGHFQVPGGLLGRTRDGGRTWRFTSGVAPGVSGRANSGLSAVRFFDAQRGLVAASDGAIFASEDGGENWAPVRYGDGTLGALSALDFIDGETGWAVGGAGVLRTQDGGLRWNRTATRGRDRVAARAVRFLDAMTGWIAGAHAALLYTLDGGVTWEAADTPLSEGERPTLRDVWFADVRHGWAVGEEGTILATGDGGDTWTRQDTGIADARSAPKLERIRRGDKVDLVDAGDRTPGLTLAAVRFVDARRGWIAGYYAGLGRSLILRTDDGGATWRVDADIAGEELHTLFVQGGDRLWAIGARVREGPQAIYRRSLAAAAGSN